MKSCHRSGIRQYPKDKPIKRGVKLWVHADSANGYRVAFNIYIGRDAAREISDFGLGYDVVMDHLFVDNFCMSMHLFKHLLSHGVLATGTALETQRDLPQNLNTVRYGQKGKRGAQCSGRKILLVMSCNGWTIK